MSIPYGKYKKTRDAAWQCLLDNKISKLPVSVSCIAKSNRIKVGTYSSNADLLVQLGFSNFSEHDGISIRCGNDFAIFYRDSLPLANARFAVAHELGHIFLGHLLPTVRNGNTFEREANAFASKLLAPTCVLWILGVHKSSDVSSLCNIPLSVAKSRAARIRNLYRREKSRLSAGQESCFLLSPLERKVFRCFGEYIKQSKQKPPRFPRAANYI